MVSISRILRIGGSVVLVVIVSGGCGYTNCVVVSSCWLFIFVGVVYWLKAGGGNTPGSEGDGEVVRYACALASVHRVPTIIICRKREHYVRIQRMCISTGEETDVMHAYQHWLWCTAVTNLLPALKDAVMSVLDTDSITTQLKNK